jgi:Leucine-rich repeat (LRR) protein
MEYIPNEIGNLVNLTELDVAFAGPLLAIPEQLCNCRALEYLYVDKNNIVPYCFQGSRNPRFHLILK